MKKQNGIREFWLEVKMQVKEQIIDNKPVEFISYILTKIDR